MAELLRKDLYYCKACQCSFSRHTKLRNHMASHTPEENMLYGDIFSFVWSSPKKEVKQAKQRRRKKLRCPVCYKRYLRVDHYSKHMWNVHGINKKSTSVLKSPLLQLKYGRKGKDSVVNKDKAINIALSMTGFVSKSEKAHIRHLDPVKSVRGRKRESPPKGRSFQTELKNKKYYECSECKKRMTHPSTLKAHMRIHTGERPYQCPSCPKTFTFYQCLWNHSWCHKTKKSFACDQCPKKFRYYQCLWNHYKVHTDKKPFVCDVCKMRFATSSQLMYHMKKHPDYLEAKIKSCGTRYFRTSDISEMPFKCEVCCKSFRLKVSLMSHKGKHHSFVSTLKPQLRFQKNKKDKKSSDISQTKNRREPFQNQKRGRGRPRKYAGLKEVGRKVLVNTKENERPISKQHHTCHKCNKLSMDCVCYAVCRGKENLCNLSPSTTINNHNLTGQNQVYHAKCKNETSCALNAGNEYLPKNRGNDENSFPKLSLRRSERLRGKRVVVLECKICGQWLTCTSEQEKHQKSHAAANHYKCQHCNRSYKSVSRLLKHQHLVHKNTQKERAFVSKLQHCGVKMKPRKKRTQRKCSCCGTIFVSYGDYKNHITSVTCICGQQFQCGYIFCFHSSTCGEHDASVREVTVDQKSEDTSLSLITEENSHHDLAYLGDGILPAQEGSESPLVFTDVLSWVSDPNDYLLSSSTFDPCQSEGWYMQLISDSLSSKDSVVTTPIDQANQYSSTEVGGDPLLFPEASEELELNDKVMPSKEADHQVQIDEKCVDINQNCQCIVCNQIFSSLSELATHSRSHIYV